MVVVVVAAPVVVVLIEAMIIAVVGSSGESVRIIAIKGRVAALSAVRRGQQLGFQPWLSRASPPSKRLRSPCHY